jgi:hypothetical protein
MTTSLVLLDPTKIRLAKDRGEWLLLTTEDNPEPVRVKPARCFPLTEPEHYVSLLIDDDTEYGMLYDPRQLEPKSRRVLRRTLERMYFLPVIQKINSISDDLGVMRWDVETSKGPRVFEVRGRDDVRLVTQGHVVIRDIDGNRYHIPDLSKLDANSRLMMEVAL